MQTYVLKLAAGDVRPFNLVADLFVYESATATPSTGDTRIKIKPDNGAEMVLRPGQRFRLPPGEKATHWEVRANDPAVALDGAVIIGSGEFDDANTLNKFTLDASLANNVTVTNTTAQRVPVALDPTAVLNTNQNIMQYTNSWESSAAGNIYIKVLDASLNVNGVDIKQVLMAGGLASGSVYTLVAKTGTVAPANLIDGDVIDADSWNAGGTISRKALPGIRVPAGKSIWYCNGGDTAGSLYKSVLYSIL